MHVKLTTTMREYVMTELNTKPMSNDDIACKLHDVLEILDGVYDTLVGGTNDELITCIDEATESVASALWCIHKEVQSRVIRESYEGSVCPDCGDDIPTDVVNGQTCENCGHTFVDPRLNDDAGV